MPHIIDSNEFGAEEEVRDAGVLDRLTVQQREIAEAGHLNRLARLRLASDDLEGSSIEGHPVDIEDWEAAKAKSTRIIQVAFGLNPDEVREEDFQPDPDYSLPIAGEERIYATSRRFDLGGGIELRETRLEFPGLAYAGLSYWLSRKEQ